MPKSPEMGTPVPDNGGGSERFTLERFAAGLKGDAAKVWEEIKSVVNPDEGKYASKTEEGDGDPLSEEQVQKLEAQGVPEDKIFNILRELDLAIVEGIEQSLPPQQRQVLDAVRKDVRPNSIGHYTKDVSYAAIGKRLGMAEDEVEEIMWELDKKKLVKCYVMRSKSLTQKWDQEGEPYMESHDTGAGYDSFDVRPWHPDEKNRKAVQKRGGTNDT